jgi:uncharacterized protein
MASTNQSPFYQRAAKEFLEAATDEERIPCLEIMIKECPKHKSAENMLKNLTMRLKKLRQNIVKRKKAGKSSQQGIKKADMQCVLAGFPNSGKSQLFNLLTKQNAKVSPHEFTTYQPKLGTFKFPDAQIQIIDQPSFPNHSKSLVNSTDTILLVVDNIDQIKKAEEFTYRTKAKTILIFNKSDLLNENELRKLKATLKSKHKKLNAIIFSSTKSTKGELEQLKKMIFDSFPIIRVYTKEPKKAATKEPMIMKPKSTLKDAAEKILKGMSKKIKRARVWGPSSKFGGQVIGLDHVLKDKDVVEFKVK